MIYIVFIYFFFLLVSFSWGGEIEVLLLAELCQVQISVVQIETLSILTYSPSDATHCDQIYLLYTGQHYDSLIAASDSDDSDRTCRFPGGGSYDEAALACARTHKQAWEDNLRTRLRKRIKCLGCNAIVKDAEAFQQHCDEVEHADDFCYDCEDIEVTEMVALATDN